jgi:hypothetical protein
MFGPAVELLLGERDGAPYCAAEVRLGGSGDVGGQAPESGPARRVSGHGAEAHDVGVGQELAWVGGFGGTGGGEWVAVERGACGVGQGELAARLEAGEVHEQVGPLGGGEHEPVGGDGNGRGQQAAVGADLGDPVEFGSAVAQQDEPEGAGVGSVEHAQPVGRGLCIVDRPHLAVDYGERREGLNRPRVGLVDQLAGEPAAGGLPEVAVLHQQRHLKRRPLRQAELTLALVADDPQAGQSRVHRQPGHPHDVVVVPQQRRPLDHRVVADRVLAGGEDVLGPPVGRGGGHRAVQMHDRIAGQRRGVRVGGAAAQARQALDGNPRHRRSRRGRA